MSPAADYAVVGLGLSGRSSARFLAARGARIVAMDSRAEPPCAADVRSECPLATVMTGGLDGELLARCGTVVLSPGLAPNHPALAAARRAGVAIIGDIELFARHATAPVVAITGTNGKSTVTSVVGEMLVAAGRRVRIGGNLGTPALDLLDGTAPDCFVLELSSFQLELVESLAPAVAAILNVTPDHLDRYASFADYVAAKARILAGAGHVVLNHDDAVTAGLSSHGPRSEFTLGAPGPGRFGLRDGRVLAGPQRDYFAADQLTLAGRHNIANALAALAICAALGADDAAATAALRAFRGLEHRAETVATVAGVTFVNDSKATNTGAACAAILGLCADRRGVLIAGGEAKESDFAAFADAVAAHMRAVVLIGRAAPLLAGVLAARVPVHHAADMLQAVHLAAGLAEPGDLVLLAPACASFDMFRDYTDRGRAFRAAVHGLEAA